MELLGERPVWSMSGGETLSELDAVNAEIARLKTRGLHLIAGLDDTGYANEMGAHDTARLLAARYRLDPTEAHRDVRLARALPKYPTVSAALPDTSPAPFVGDPDSADGAGSFEPDRADVGDGADGADGGAAGVPARGGVPDGVPDPDGASRREAVRFKCWGEETSAVPQASRSINRWPDDATRREATRFAVWGNTSASGTASDPDSEPDAAPDQRMQDGGSEPPAQLTNTTNPVNTPAAANTADASITKANPADVPL